MKKVYYTKTASFVANANNNANPAGTLLIATCRFSKPVWVISFGFRQDGSSDGLIGNNQARVQQNSPICLGVTVNGAYQFVPAVYANPQADSFSLSSDEGIINRQNPLELTLALRSITGTAFALFQVSFIEMDEVY